MATCDEFPELFFEDDNDNMPWDYPCWNDDWEHELRDAGYKTVKEQNEIGRSVKKGEKGKYLHCAKIRVFDESQTTTSSFSNNNNSDQTKRYFETFEEATSWEKENPGKTITRAPEGNGYIEK